MLSSFACLDISTPLNYCVQEDEGEKKRIGKRKGERIKHSDKNAISRKLVSISRPTQHE